MERPTRPMSPCLNICTLDEQNVCMGCRRTVDEIQNWALLSPAEQWQLVEELQGRQQSQNF